MIKFKANLQGVVSYPDPDSHYCGWIISPLPGSTCTVWRMHRSNLLVLTSLCYAVIHCSSTFI